MAAASGWGKRSTIEEARAGLRRVETPPTPKVLSEAEEFERRRNSLFTPPSLMAIDIHPGYRIIELCTPHITDEDYRQLGFDILLKGFGFGGINPITLVNPKEARIVSDFIEHYIKAGFKAEDIRNQGSWETPRRLNDSHVGVIEILSKFMESVRIGAPVAEDEAQQVCKIAHNPYVIPECNGESYLTELKKRLAPRSTRRTFPSANPRHRATPSGQSFRVPSVPASKAITVPASRIEDSSLGFMGSRFIDLDAFSFDQKQDIVRLSHLAHVAYAEGATKEELFSTLDLEDFRDNQLEFLGVFDTRSTEKAAVSGEKTSVRLLAFYKEDTKELIIAVRGTVAGGEHGLANVLADIGIGKDMSNEQIIRDIKNAEYIKQDSEHLFRNEEIKAASRGIPGYLEQILPLVRPEEGKTLDIAQGLIRRVMGAFNFNDEYLKDFIQFSRRTLINHIMQCSVGVHEFKSKLESKRKKVRGIKFTGHSLGGYLSQILAIYEMFVSSKHLTGVEVSGFSFNGPGVNKDTLRNFISELEEIVPDFSTESDRVRVRAARIEKRYVEPFMATLAKIDTQLISIINEADYVGSLGLHSGLVVPINYDSSSAGTHLFRLKRVHRELLDKSPEKYQIILDRLVEQRNIISDEINGTRLRLGRIWGRAPMAEGPVKEQKKRELEELNQRIAQYDALVRELKENFEARNTSEQVPLLGSLTPEKISNLVQAGEVINEQHSIAILRDYLRRTISMDRELAARDAPEAEALEAGPPERSAHSTAPAAGGAGSGRPGLSLNSAASASRSDSRLRFTGGAAGLSPRDEEDDG